MLQENTSVNSSMNENTMVNRKIIFFTVYSTSVWSFMGFSDGRNIASLLLQYL